MKKVAGDSSQVEAGVNHSRLIEMGWRQGVLFTAPSASFVKNVADLDASSQLVIDASRKPRPREVLVVASHDCDIRSDDEPNIEALLCNWLDPKKDNSQKRANRVDRSPRAFVVDPAAIYIAVAWYRVHVCKSVLLSGAIQPMNYSMSESRRLRFREWLARRYDRPRVPDELHQTFFTPVLDLLDKLESARPEVMRVFNRGVHDIRVTIPRILNRPAQIGITVLLKMPAASEQLSNAIQEVFDAIRSVVSPEDVVIDDECAIYALAEAPYGLILTSEPLSAEHLSFEDPAAAMPAWLHYELEHDNSPN